MLVYSVWKFRAGPDDDSDGPPTHGHTQLEIVWTAIPAVLVTAISIVSAIVLAQNGHAGTNPLIIKVDARQFAWTFTYPNGKSYGYLTLPQGRHVKLDITADDVIHSFWVPQLSQKQDAVPGPAQLPRDHADAHRHVPGDLHRALRPRPLADAQPRRHPLRRPTTRSGCSAGGAASAGPPGLAVFQQNGCAGCHTFKPAAATGTVGPNLDNLAQEAKQAHRGALDAFIEESIVKPERLHRARLHECDAAHLRHAQIPPDKLKQLVQYLAQGPTQ